MKELVMKNIVIAVVLLLSLLGGIAVGVLGVGKIPFLAELSRSTETRRSEVIKSVTKEEQVVLLSLAIEGIEEEKQSAENFFGVEISGTERTSLLRYEITGKLGVEGKDVKVTEIGENRYRVSIPRFIAIAFDPVTRADGEKFLRGFEANGALSWVSERIDTVEMTNRIFADDRKEKYLKNNEEALRLQAEHFYTRIISSIDPSAIVEFTFAN